MITSDETLLAFVDGELDAAESAAVERAIAADPTLAARVAAERELKAQLRAAFDPVLAEPVPESLLALTSAAPVVDDLAAARARRAERRQSWSWREWSAVAATLVMGVLLGPYVLRQSQPLPFISENGRVVAIGSLDTALLSQIAGAPPQDAFGTSIGMSFRSNSGTYCRTFAMNPGPAGVACRERGDWVVELLSRNPRPRSGPAPDAYRQAGTPFPEAIRQAVEARIDGDPLGADEEAAAAQRKWRSQAN